MGFPYPMLLFKRFCGAKKIEEKKLQEPRDLIYFAVFSPLLHFMINSIKPFRCCSIMFVNTYFYVSAPLFADRVEKFVKWL